MAREKLYDNTPLLVRSRVNTMVIVGWYVGLWGLQEDEEVPQYIPFGGNIYMLGSHPFGPLVGF
jgi:hypothetical protein